MSDVLSIALVGNPNCGKTSLFNHLTGTRQKVANYAGVTVERKVGNFTLASGKSVRVLDLPGAYSLNATSPDEEITRDVVQGKIAEEQQQDVFLCVVDATNLKLHLGLVLEMVELGRPILVVLNMMDEARRRGIQINTQKLYERLGVPVVESVAVRSSGVENLLNALDQGKYSVPQTEMNGLTGDHHQKVNTILHDVVQYVDEEDKRSDFLDRIFLHPVFGLITLTLIMFIIFQAVFAWAEPFKEAIEDHMIPQLGEWLGAIITQPLLHSLVVDGILAGAGTVLAFLPQILILFFFILAQQKSWLSDLVDH